MVTPGLAKALSQKPLAGFGKGSKRLRVHFLLPLDMTLLPWQNPPLDPIFLE